MPFDAPTPTTETAITGIYPIHAGNYAAIMGRLAYGQLVDQAEARLRHALRTYRKAQVETAKGWAFAQKPAAWRQIVRDEALRVRAARLKAGA